MRVIEETKYSVTFLISLLGKTFLLKLYKRKHPLQINYLRKLEFSHFSFNELGEKLYSMENDQKKGVYNGADYLNILNIRFF